LKGGFNTTKVTEKYDGSPSLVFGHDPKTKKFFVATKSAFNKDPKINYTDEDIEKNHGHAPGLVEKLKTALQHLPKVAPKSGVYQGDILHTKDDVHEAGGEYHFTPNTIMYSTPKGSEEGKKIKDSKIGLVVHSKYHGPSLDNMRVGFDPDHINFKQHKDVHLVNPEIVPGKHGGEAATKFEHHILAAEKEMTKAHPDTLDTIKAHAPHIKTYINKCVKEGKPPSTAGYRGHLLGIGEKKVASVSTAKAKQQHHDHMMTNLHYAEEHAKKFDSLFKIHRHLQHAKNALIQSLQGTSQYEHSVNGEETKPEGYVAVKDGHPIKLVDRAEFSHHNMNKVRPKAN
jgi:hypothetical protein